MKIFIIVPVYNEGRVFQEWLPTLLKVAEELGARVVVVDDGSEQSIDDGRWSMVDGPLAIVKLRHEVNCGSSSLHLRTSQFQLRRTDNVVVLRHQVNCGAGAAIATGMEYAKQQGADMVVTIDGDGQHDPRDLIRLVEVLMRGEVGGGQGNEEVEKRGNSSVDIVNGSRFLKKQWVPWSRRVANFLANVITFALSGFWVSDSQSGMKGFHKKALEEIKVQTAGYEWCTDIFREANWYGLRLQEIPISVLYNKHSLSKGQNLAVGIDMVMRLVVRSLWK